MQQYQEHQQLQTKKTLNLMQYNSSESLEDHKFVKEENFTLYPQHQEHQFNETYQQGQEHQANYNHYFNSEIFNNNMDIELKFEDDEQKAQEKYKICDDYLIKQEETLQAKKWVICYIL